jgi:tetratricopeptide (TPR) repeat protein
MIRAPVALAGLALLCAACRTPLEVGERLYREGDRLGALETWRGIEEDDPRFPQARARIAVVEEESQQLFERYRKRGSYFEEKGRLAESILDYRLALRLRPDDTDTLDKVQSLARVLKQRKATLASEYDDALAAGDLARARNALEERRRLDAFGPEIETDERYLRAALRAEVTRRLEAARDALSSADFPLARGELDRVLALDPDNESARGYLAYIDVVERQRRASSGLDAPEAFASEAEVRAEGFYQNALAAEQAGDLYAAIRNDLEALDADPGHRRANVHLAHLRERLADRVEVLIEMGREAFQNEDLQSAIDHWRLALLIDPANERTRAYVARAEQQLANLESLRSDTGVGTKGN